MEIDEIEKRGDFVLELRELTSYTTFTESLRMFEWLKFLEKQSMVFKACHTVLWYYLLSKRKTFT